MDKLKEKLVLLDEQLVFWDALHDHCFQYLSAIMSCTERNSSIGSVMGIGNSCLMGDIKGSLDRSYYQMLQTLYKPLQSTLVKCNKVLIRIQSICKEAEMIVHTQNISYQDPIVSHYMYLFDIIQNGYFREFARLKEIIKSIPTLSNETEREQILDEFNSKKYIKSLTTLLAEEGL